MELAPVSIDSIEQRIRERADMVDSQFVTSAEVRRFAEAAWQELYSIMVASGEDLFIRRARITSSAVDPLTTEEGDLLVTENGDVIIVGGVVLTSSYINFPGQVKALRLLRHVDGTRVRKATLHDVESLSTSERPAKPLFYRPELDPRNTYLRLELYPQPDRSYEFDLFYVPALSLDEFLTTGYSSIPVRSWDEYVVLTAAAKCRDKEEGEISNLMKEREILLERIRADLIPFDKSEPDVVAQIAGSGYARDAEEMYWGQEEAF